MQIKGPVEIISPDGRFMIEIDEQGFAIRELKTQGIIMDGSTFFYEGEVTFGPKDFKVRHRKRMEKDGKTVLYDYYALKHRPVIIP